jgi:tetratricopeptide (TPR) repeat protein
MGGFREIVFEFDEEGTGEFRPTGNVARAITGHLMQEELDQAVSLLAASGPEVGDRLIADAEVGASKELWRRLARLFGKARDVGRAARCAEATDDHELAAELHEAAYDWVKAAAAYRAAGNLFQAAAMHERGLEFDKAAAAYHEAGDHLRAAECYAKAGANYHAGHLYMRLGRYEQAVAVLQRVERTDKWYAESSTLLAQFFEKTGNAKAAAERYAEVVRARPIDKTTVEAHHRLASMLAGAGRHDDARQLWNAVIGLWPGHPGAVEGMRLLPARGETTGAGEDEPPALALPGEGSDGEEKASGPVVGVRGDFDVLRSLPIFSGLSLDELRAVHTLADRVTFAPGEVLIEQDQEGRALFVLASGRVVVEIAVAGKEPREVATLGAGASLGEMAMVDQAPASARVTAVEETSAFRFPIERLDAHLKADPRAGYKVMRVLGRILSTRLREANRALTE